MPHSRKESIKLSKLDVNKVINGFLPLLVRTIPKTITVEANQDNSIPQILANESQIEQLLLNFEVNSQNAIKHAKGLISITAAIRNHKKTDSNFLLKFTNAVTLTDFIYIPVEDNGSGFDMNKGEQLFKPFYTTDSKRRMGLGLA
jgi:nitrogen-specific signal transduction histidine kinase